MKKLKIKMKNFVGALGCVALLLAGSGAKARSPMLINLDGPFKNISPEEILQTIYPNLKRKPAGFHAELGAAKKRKANGHDQLVVIPVTWTGEHCEAQACTPTPADVAVLELQNGKLVMIAKGAGVTKWGGALWTEPDLAPYKFNEKETLIGVRMNTANIDFVMNILQLFRVEGDKLRLVFEKEMINTNNNVLPAKGLDYVGCESTLAVGPPASGANSLKIITTCNNEKGAQTKKEEIWIWNGTQYALKK